MELYKLDEVSKLAADKASSVLSKLIDEPVGVAISPAVVLAKGKSQFSPHPDGMAVGITAPLSGDLNGMSLMCFSKVAALNLCDLLLHRSKGETKKFSGLEISALTELTNIVVGNFLGIFSRPLKLNSVMHHVPNFTYGSFNNILEDVISQTQHNVENKSLVEIAINLQNHRLNGSLVLMLGAEEVRNVLEK